MQVLLFMMLLCFFSSGALQEPQPSYYDPNTADTGWNFEKEPVWSDEFEGDHVDTSRWVFVTGGDGWGNNEAQYYTNGANSAQSGGNLLITARKEKFSKNAYTSSRMVTNGKYDWLYGRFEVRAKLPAGRGTWPAIWMLPSDNEYGTWPASGEIDIMEHVGFDPDKVHCSIHTSAYNHIRGTQKTASKRVQGAIGDFHTYRVDWTPGYIRGFIDGQQYFEFINENTGFTTWPFNKCFHLILNLAVGGNWGGAKGIDENAFPANMSVDYVRVYRLAGR